MSENGQADVDQVILTRDRKTGQVAIGGNVTDIDLCLNMLSQATRHMDVQFRVIAAFDAQAQVQKRKEELKFAQDFMRK